MKVLKPYLFFSLIGAFLCVVNIFVHFVLKAEICHTSSCHIVSNFSRLSDAFMSFLGLAYFFVVFIGGVLLESKKTLRKKFENFYFLFVFSGFLFEAVLVGRQFFDLKMLCYFCMAVACFAFLTALTYGFQTKRLSFLLSFPVILFAMWLTPMNVVPLFENAYPLFRDKPVNKEMVLIYSERCPHCKEVLKWCEEKGVNILLCPKEEALSFLRVNNIGFVPVLFVEENDEKKGMFLYGKDTIISFLSEDFFSEDTVEKNKRSFSLDISPPPGLFLNDGTCSIEEKSCN